MVWPSVGSSCLFQLWKLEHVDCQLKWTQPLVLSGLHQLELRHFLLCQMTQNHLIAQTNLQQQILLPSVTLWCKWNNQQQIELMMTMMMIMTDWQGAYHPVNDFVPFPTTDLPHRPSYHKTSLLTWYHNQPTAILVISLSES